jgi:hypothetical protein
MARWGSLGLARQITARWIVARWPSHRSPFSCTSLTTLEIGARLSFTPIISLTLPTKTLAAPSLTLSFLTKRLSETHA